MSQAVTRTYPTPIHDAELMEQIVIKGDLSKLAPNDRGAYYMAVCRSVGLNPLTKPFEYITLNGKMTLYALRNCTDQLRAIHKVSVVDMTETERDGVCVVTCKVQNAEGRTDMAKGAVSVGGLKGEALANAIMKAETKAKRRATLSICGLSLLDETEVEDIPDKRINPHVNRPEDIVDVPSDDDPDRIWLEGDAKAPAELPRMQQRPIADKLGKELAAFTRLEDLEKWKSLPETAQRLWTIRHEWREVFQGRLKERLMELRSAQKMNNAAESWAGHPENGATVGSQRQPHHEGGGTSLDEGDPLDVLTDAYSACADAAAMWDVDQKLYIPFVQTASPDDRERANDIRQQHLDRIEGVTQ